VLTWLLGFTWSLLNMHGLRSENMSHTIPTIGIISWAFPFFWYLEKDGVDNS
jgi:hypothetical protein